MARICPIGKPSAFERLVAEGVVRLPDRPERAAPDPVDADVSLAEIVMTDRR